MNEKTILKISLFLVLIGLVFLYLYASEFNFKAIENFDNLPLEEEVELSGIVSRVSQTEKVTFLELAAQKKETLTIVVFNHDDIRVQEGDYIELTGTVEDYEGKMEIIANQVIIK
ncbi:MAG: OB-fold nucleic acid binding domain-containing protein [Nanoarchaeota archaeon]|nr:OB-fold nucleic acid binding domain-containing protein [Nanoarchaeota archaeon]